MAYFIVLYSTLWRVFKVEEMAKRSHSTGIKVIKEDKDIKGHVKDEIEYSGICAIFICMLMNLFFNYLWVYVKLKIELLEKLA